LFSALLQYTFKDKIFAYIQDYYRCFMKQKSAEDFPVYIWSGEK